MPCYCQHLFVVFLKTAILTDCEVTALWFWSYIIVFVLISIKWEPEEGSSAQHMCTSCLCHNDSETRPGSLLWLRAKGSVSLVTCSQLPVSTIEAQGGVPARHPHCQHRRPPRPQLPVSGEAFPPLLHQYLQSHHCSSWTKQFKACCTWIPRILSPSSFRDVDPVFVPIPHYFDYCSFVVLSEIWEDCASYFFPSGLLWQFWVFYGSI